MIPIIEIRKVGAIALLHKLFSLVDLECCLSFYNDLRGSSYCETRFHSEKARNIDDKVPCSCYSISKDISVSTLFHYVSGCERELTRGFLQDGTAWLVEKNDEFLYDIYTLLSSIPCSVYVLFDGRKVYGGSNKLTALVAKKFGIEYGVSKEKSLVNNELKRLQNNAHHIYTLLQDIVEGLDERYLNKLAKYINGDCWISNQDIDIAKTIALVRRIKNYSEDYNGILSEIDDLRRGINPQGYNQYTPRSMKHHLSGIMKCLETTQEDLSEFVKSLDNE